VTVSTSGIRDAAAAIAEDANGAVVTASRAPGRAPGDKPVRAREIIYVLGYGRSGSTLLDVLIGNAAGVESVGELDLLHRNWDGQSCSCGAKYDDCTFWSSVDHVARERIGDRSHRDREKVLRRVERISSLPALILGILPRSWRRSYRDQVRAEADAIAAVGGQTSILDSSKSAREAAGRALALGSVAGISVKMIHLVRDGRAVLWSALRGDNVKLAEGVEGERARVPFALFRAVFGWMLANLVASVTPRLKHRGQVLRVRYEDLVTEPDAQLERIGSFLGRDLSDVRRKIREGESFPVGHNTGGNRMRRGGAVKLRIDREWERRLPPLDRAVFWVFAWPWALVFGYRPGRSPGD
jgi:hypothetical protein